MQKFDFLAVILSCKFAMKASTFSTFGIACNLSKIKCTTMNMNAICRRALRRTEFRTPCLPMNVLCRSAAQLLQCVLIVYIWPGKGVACAVRSQSCDRITTLRGSCRLASGHRSKNSEITAKQGCGVGVGVGVGVARSRGNEPGVGVGVGVDQTASTPTPERFV